MLYIIIYIIIYYSSKHNIVINPLFDANIHRFEDFIQSFDIIQVILRIILDFQKCMINNRIIFLGIKVRDFNEYPVDIGIDDTVYRMMVVTCRHGRRDRFHRVLSR
jgi:hypothetical protein